MIKKVFRTNKNTYFYEDVRMNVKNKTVHSKAHSLAHDMKEAIDKDEVDFRTHYKKNINILGFSLYWRPLESGRHHMSIVEHDLLHPFQSWSSAYKTYFERRDAFHYIKSRWFAH